jgi:hypothetical protein
MYITAKLEIFLELSLQQEHILYLPFTFYLKRAVYEKQGSMNGRLAIILMDRSCTCL